MQKYVLGILAVAGIAFLVAFTNNKQRPSEEARSESYFIYLPDEQGTTEGDFEDTGKWMYSPTPPIDCEGGDVTCYIRVANENLVSGATPVEKLVNFLIQQDGGAGEYASDLAAVEDLTEATRPEN